MAVSVSPLIFDTDVTVELSTITVNRAETTVGVSFPVVFITKVLRPSGKSNPIRPSLSEVEYKVSKPS